MQNAFVFGGRPLVAPTKSRWGQCAKSGRNLRIEMVYRLLEIAPIFNGLFADSVVGATTGRPLPIHSADKTTAQGSLVQRRLPHGDVRERVDHARKTAVLRRVCTDFAPRVGACAACHAHEGVGGRNAKPTAQTKSAADPRPSRRQRRRRPTRGFGCTSNPNIAEAEYTSW